MAENSIVAAAPTDCVWAVLADASTYGHWVVGAKAIRSSEDGWPAPGARFHHTQGFGPVTLVSDETEVLEGEPERRLLLEARMRPFLVLHIELVLEAIGSEQTRIRINERPVGGPLRPLGRILEAGIKLRNVESLERLRTLAEERFAERPLSAPRLAAGDVRAVVHDEPEGVERPAEHA